MENYKEIIGTIAGICTTFSFLPQVIQIWKSHSVKDISLDMYFILCLGTILWAIYGFLISSFPIILFNIITLVLTMSILIMKLVWK